LGLELCDFFHFFFVGLYWPHILSSGLVELTWVDISFFSTFLIDFFFSFASHYLVCLRANLHYFIQFLLFSFFMWEVILISWPRCECSMLTWVGSFYPFFFKKKFSSSFNVCLAGNWALDFFFIIFLFVRLYVFIYFLLYY